MMNVMIKVLVICLVAALLAAVLKKSNPEMALLLAVAVTVIILLGVAEKVRDITAFLREVLDSAALPGVWFVPLLKAVPIALLSRLGAELCRDASQNAMAALVEMTGALSVLLVILPLFEAAWELLKSLQ